MKEENLIRMSNDIWCVGINEMNRVFLHFVCPVGFMLSTQTDKMVISMLKCKSGQR